MTKTDYIVKRNVRLIASSLRDMCSKTVFLNTMMRMKLSFTCVCYLQSSLSLEKNRADFYQRMLMMMMIVMGINIANTKYGGARIIESSA